MEEHSEEGDDDDDEGLSEEDANSDGPKSRCHRWLVDCSTFK